MRDSYRRPTVRALGAAVAFTLAIFVGPATAAAGPWVPEPGDGYLKLSGSYFDATGVYDREGRKLDAEYSYSHAAVRAYGEVGLAPHVGLSASVPWMRSQNADKTSQAKYIKTGLGDLDLALQGGKTIGNVAISVVGQVRVPLYSETISAEAPSPQSLNQQELERQRYVPALGDGSVDVTARLEAGLSLHPFPGWVTVSGGPKFRFQGFGDGFEYAASAGAYLVPDRLAVTLRASGVERFSSGNERPTKRFFMMSGGPIVRIAGGFSVEATGSHLPSGAFVSEGWSANVGVSYDGSIFPNPWGSSEPAER